MFPRFVPTTIRAHPISGSGRGRHIGTPTINVRLADIPADVAEGIYACRAQLGDGPFEDAVLHYGPRPVFHDSLAFEVHLLDRVIHRAPDTLTVAIVGWLREVRDFPSVEALQAQIARDIADARAMLLAHPA